MNPDPSLVVAHETSLTDLAVRWRHVVAALVIISAASCEFGSTTPDTPGSRDARVVPVGEVEVLQGEGQQGVVADPLPEPVRVRVLDRARRPIAGMEVEFKPESSDHGDVSLAFATTDPNGVAETRWTLGNQAGEQRLDVRTRRQQGIHRRVVASAVPGRPESVAVTPASPSLVAGEALRLGATASDRHGNVVSDATFSWSSSSPAVAVVDDHGLVTGVGSGTAAIVATTGSATGYSTVTVTASTTGSGTPAAVTSLRVTDATTESVTLAFEEVDDGTGKPARYQMRYIAGPMQWNWGLGTVVTEGTCAHPIEGSAVGGTRVCSALGLEPATTYEFQVVAYRGSMTEGTAVFGPLSNIAAGATSSVLLDIVSGDGQAGTVGQTLGHPLVVRVRDGTGNPIGGITVAWGVTSGGGNLSQSASTTVNGFAQVSWTLGTTAGDNALVASVASLTSVGFSAYGAPGAPTSVVVTPSSVSLTAGANAQLTGTAYDQYGNAVSGVVFDWSSSNTAVADVNDSGLVSGVGEGTVTITAAIGTVAGESIVSVTESSSESGLPGTVTTLRVTETTAGSGTLAFEEVKDGTGQPARYQMRYVVAPMGWNWGTATVVTSGTCAHPIEGTSVGATRTCSVVGLEASTTYDFQVVAYRGDMNDGSAVFGPLSNVATGTTSASDGSGGGGGGGGTSGTASLVVTPSGPITLYVGSTAQLSVAAYDADGAPISNPDVTWSSSNESVATVSTEGLVTARLVGTALITASAACCDSTAVEVVVQDPASGGSQPTVAWDWSTAMGFSDDALRDTNKPVPLTGWRTAANRADLLNVVNQPGGFPSSNVLRTLIDGPSSSEVRAYNLWPVPEPGQSIYYRLYVRLDIPNSYGNLPAGPFHPIQPDIGECGRDWAFYFGPFSDGGFELGFSFQNSGAGFYSEPSPSHGSRRGILRKFTTYRIEWAFHRQQNGTYKVDIRIHDAAGNLVADANTFISRWSPEYTSTMAQVDPDVRISDYCVRRWIWGSNGPAGWPNGTDLFITYGAAAFRLSNSSSDWIGP